ncbi:MAG: Hpt domain-containing protein [Lachnospiraceae bacterium]|nr:Hpt domain-containing protein [Lachnospiraceae bacterium]
MTEEQRERLTEGGLDVSRGMERFLQKDEMYFRFLKRFLEDKSYEELEAAMKSKDYQKAFGHAHTLKGLLANLAITGPMEALQPLTEKLRYEEKEGLEEMMEEFVRRFQRAWQAIESLE